MTPAQYVKAIRMRGQLSQADLAHQLGCSVRTIIRWEYGDTTPMPMMRYVLGIVARDVGIQEQPAWDQTPPAQPTAKDPRRVP